MDEIGLTATGVGTVLNVTSKTLHNHHNSKHQRTPGSWKRLNAGAPNRRLTDQRTKPPEQPRNGARSSHTTGSTFRASKRSSGHEGKIISDQSKGQNPTTGRSHLKGLRNDGLRKKDMKAGNGKAKGTASQKRDQKRNRNNGSDTEGRHEKPNRKGGQRQWKRHK